MISVIVHHFLRPLVPRAHFPKASPKASLELLYDLEAYS